MTGSAALVGWRTKRRTTFSGRETWGDGWYKVWWWQTSRVEQTGMWRRQQAVAMSIAYVCCHIWMHFVIWSQINVPANTSSSHVSSGEFPNVIHSLHVFANFLFREKEHTSHLFCFFQKIFEDMPHQKYTVSIPLLKKQPGYDVFASSIGHTSNVALIWLPIRIPSELSILTPFTLEQILLQ